MSERLWDTTSFTEISREILGQGTALRFRAHGNSMRPFIRDGDVLTVHPVAVDSLKRADVILFRRETEGLTLHRIIRRIAREGSIAFVTRGDAALAFAEEIPAERVLGKLVAVQRGDRHLRPDRGWLRCAALVWILFRRLRWLARRLRQ